MIDALLTPEMLDIIAGGLAVIIPLLIVLHWQRTQERGFYDC